MRRTVCIFQILLFLLGPLAAILPASAESRLPACCRRHGEHRCAISTAMAAKSAQAINGSTPALNAPSHCSSYPGYLFQSTEPLQALAASTAKTLALAVTPHSLNASRAAARLSQVRTRAGRGPPTSDIG